jgi:hypothetical protein
LLLRCGSAHVLDVGVGDDDFGRGSGPMTLLSIANRFGELMSRYSHVDIRWLDGGVRTLSDAEIENDGVRPVASRTGELVRTDTGNE